MGFLFTIVSSIEMKILPDESQLGSDLGFSFSFSKQSSKRIKCHKSCWYSHSCESLDYNTFLRFTKLKRDFRDIVGSKKPFPLLPEWKVKTRSYLEQKISIFESINNLCLKLCWVFLHINHIQICESFLKEHLSLQISHWSNYNANFFVPDH